MKSTDMFLSAENRMKEQEPILLNTSSLEQPKGLAPSPFVVSLWDTKKIPKQIKQNNKTINNNILDDKIINDKDEELESIENLFRGNGRITYSKNNYNNASYFSQSEQEKMKEIENIKQLHSKNNPKEIKIPSRKEQIEKIKQSKDQYSAIFKNPSQNTGGFFRNFAFWK